MHKSHERLGTKPVHKLLISFVGPAAIGLLTQALFHIVDAIFVGQFVGPDGLAALTIVFPFMIIQFSFVTLFGSGAATLIATNLGKSKHNKAEVILGHMFTLMLIGSVFLITFGLIILNPSLKLLGLKGNLFNYCKEYLEVIILGSPFIMCICLDFTIRSEGRPNFSALIVVIGTVLNIILDPIFIKVLNLGVRGAALATIIGQGFAAILLLCYYLFKKSIVKLRLRNMRLKISLLLSIFGIGFSSFCMEISSTIQIIITNKLLITYGGKQAVTAMSIVFVFNTVCLLLAFAVGDGMMPIVSYNTGAGKPERVKKILFYAIIFIESISIIAVIFLELFPQLLFSFFTSYSPELLKIAVTALRIFAISIPFHCFQIVATRYFQAISRAKISAFTSMLHQVIIFIPVIFILSSIYGLDGIWFSFPISDGLAVLITFFMLKNFFIKNRQVSSEFKKAELLKS